MTPEELESTWSTLRPPTNAGGINGRRAPGLPADRPIYLAVDDRNHRHLLVQVPDTTSPLKQRETRGLEVTTARFQVGANPESLYVDLACTDPAQYATFGAIAQDLIRALRVARSPLRDTILGELARWRAFWSLKTSGMSRESALGLFGEVWFLRRWAGEVDLPALQGWQATESTRHDFQWPSASVEVKTATTQTAGAPTHRIASLEQLEEPQQGRLYLFSLQVCDDALAVNTLHSLVAAVVASIKDDFQALDEFSSKLAARGYSPADQDAPSRPLRILAERLYLVDASFPRLVRRTFGPDGPPAGIAGAEYTVDLSACQRWLIATAPGDVAAQMLRQPNS